VCCEQVLPFASEETLQRLETNIAAAPSITQMLHEGLAPRDIAARIFDGLDACDGGPPIVPRCGTQSKGAPFVSSTESKGVLLLTSSLRGITRVLKKGLGQCDLVPRLPLALISKMVLVFQASLVSGRVLGGELRCLTADGALVLALAEA